MILSFAQLHDEVTRLVDAIRSGGGGGTGSVVSWNQKTTAGVNIADVTINGNTTQVFAPESVDPVAENVSYDNTESGIAATDVQSAIDINSMDIAKNTSDISDINDNLSKKVDYSNRIALSGTSYTCTDDCYVTYFALAGAFKPIKINNVSVGRQDNNSTTGMYFTIFFGFAKKGDVISSDVLPSCTAIYPLV